MNPITIAIAVLVVLGLWLVGIYNSLVKNRNRVKESWSDIDVQLKRRYDLIPNLVEAVKGYAAHESQTLDAVIQARAKAMGAHTVVEHGQAENMLSVMILNTAIESFPTNLIASSFGFKKEEFFQLENPVVEREPVKVNF